MDFCLSLAEEALRSQVRNFLQEELPTEVVRETEFGMGFGPHSRAFLPKLGAKGWLAPSWPREYGGSGASYIERFIVTEELAYQGGPRGLHGASIAGPTLLRYGNEEQKKDYLPRIARGEIEFALGYTEANAGSDLVSLEMRADEGKDCYILNGQKLFSTRCQWADYHWVAARTNPNAPKHQGISLFIVDLESSGITLEPVWCMDDTRTNIVFYDNVRVPKKNLVGEKNKGWHLIMTALDFERIWNVGGLQRLFEKLMAFAKQCNPSEKVLPRDTMIRHKLAEMAIDIEVTRLLAYRVAWLQNQGVVPKYEAFMLKLHGSELEQRLANTGMQLLGLHGQLRHDSKWALLSGWVETSYRKYVYLTFGGGGSEIMRNLIAIKGFMLPRADT